jgi:hypothetical protein
MIDAPAAMRSVPSIVLPAVALMGFFLVVFLPRRSRTRRSHTGPTFVASNLWTFDYLCVAMTRVLREWPDLKEVRFDISALAVLDEASLASLERVIETTSAAGIQLRVDGYDARMARFLVGRGISLQHLGAPRSACAGLTRTLH